EASSIRAKTARCRPPFDSVAVDDELTVYTTHDKAESSKFRVYGKGSDRSVVEFIAPSSEKGKVMLMLRDAMWIYMPSASRPIRISPLQRLMGQASNGDVARTSFTVDYVPKSVTESEWEGRKTFVLDLAAKDADIAYSRVQLWIDKASYEPLRADFC